MNINDNIKEFILKHPAAGVVIASILVTVAGCGICYFVMRIFSLMPACIRDVSITIGCLSGLSGFIFTYVMILRMKQ